MKGYMRISKNEFRRHTITSNISNTFSGIVCLHEKARLENGNKRKRVFKTYLEMRDPCGDCGLEAKLFETVK